MTKRLPISIFLAALILFAGYAALFIAPDEATMHEVQRIFYFHVSVWSAMFIALSISALANIAWLVKREPRWDWLGVSAAEVGVVCCTAGLSTGPLWAKPTWGVWWGWDARLTTTFLLWLLYISYLLLRGLLDDPSRRATLSAVFGIFAYLDVPLVYASTRLWGQRGLHPKPVYFGDPGTGVAAAMTRVLLIAMASIVGVMVLLLVDRYRLEKLRFEVEELRFEVESRLSEAQPAGAAGGAIGPGGGFKKGPS